jgi:two-component system, chemotaxis family, protein-glutamate methylesterase/glutaminase
MSGRVRVLLVDDSSVVRRLLTAALGTHPEIEVVGTAANGIIALNKLAQLEPDAIILDVEMPEMDGISTLVSLRETHPRLPVIMFSTLTERGASVTFDALAAGASDYVLKPSAQSGETLESVVANTLVPKLMALTRSRFGIAMQNSMASVPFERSGPDSRLLAARLALAAGAAGKAAQELAGAPGKPLLAPFAPKPALTAPPQSNTVLPSRASMPSSTKLDSPSLAAPRSTVAHSGGLSALRRPSLASGQQLQPLVKKPVQVIAIAASTGGPNALAEVLPRLPGSLPVPIVIVQHMPPIFTRCLAERLSARCELKVVESEGGERLMPGTIYIAPGNRHLELVRDAEGVRTLLTDAAAENSCRPSADVLFRSVARVYGGAVLCVVLTGMGQDGARGAREIHDAGGRVLVQSGPTCVIWGMPKAVEDMGIAESVVPLPEIAASILQRVALGLLPLRTPGSER